MYRVVSVLTALAAVVGVRTPRHELMLGLITAFTAGPPANTGNADDAAADPRESYLQLAGKSAAEKREDNRLKMEFIWCLPGSFKMGDPGAGQAVVEVRQQVAARPDPADDDGDEPQEKQVVRTVLVRTAKPVEVSQGEPMRSNDSALAAYENAVKSSNIGQLSEPELIRHADRLCTDGFQNDAVPLLEEYLRRFKHRADIVRVKLAEILIKFQQRPQYGIRVLNELPPGPLKPRYEKLRQSLAHKAQAMIADGVLELSGRAW
jgi:hypothetical protein